MNLHVINTSNIIPNYQFIPKLKEPPRFVAGGVRDFKIINFTNARVEISFFHHSTNGLVGWAIRIIWT